MLGAVSCDHRCELSTYVSPSYSLLYLLQIIIYEMSEVLGFNHDRVRTCVVYYGERSIACYHVLRPLCESQLYTSTTGRSMYDRVRTCVMYYGEQSIACYHVL